VHTGKSYIGQTLTTLRIRRNNHFALSRLRVGSLYKSTSHFSNALRAYPKPSDWLWEVVEDNIPQSELSSREVMHIAQLDTYRAGYNSSVGGDFNPMLFSAEIRAKSKANIRPRTLTDAQRKAISIRNTGYRHTAEAKAKIAEAGRFRDFSSRALPSAATRRKMSLVQRGSRNAQSKLSDQAVTEIVTRIVAGEPYEQLAHDHAISRNTITKIASGAVWTHVDIFKKYPRPVDARAKLLGRKCFSEYKPRVKMTPELLQKARDLLASGKCVAEIARELGVDNGYLGTLLVPPESRKKQVNLSEAQKQHVHELKQLGMLNYKIAELVGVTPTTVGRIVGVKRSYSKRQATCPA